MSEISLTQDQQASAKLVDFKLPADINRHREMLQEADRQVVNIRYWMDGIFFGVGFDATIGLVPIVGDFATALTKLWLVGTARQVGVPGTGIMKIVAFGAADLMLMPFPFVGDVADFVIRSHAWSADLIRSHIGQRLCLIEEARLRAGMIEEVPADHPAFRELRTRLALAV